MRYLPMVFPSSVAGVIVVLLEALVFRGASKPIVMARPEILKQLGKIRIFTLGLFVPNCTRSRLPASSSILPLDGQFLVLGLSREPAHPASTSVISMPFASIQHHNIAVYSEPISQLTIDYLFAIGFNQSVFGLAGEVGGQTRRSSDRLSHIAQRRMQWAFVQSESSC